MTVQHLLVKRYNSSTKKQYELRDKVQIVAVYDSSRRFITMTLLSASSRFTERPQVRQPLARRLFLATVINIA